MQPLTRNAGVILLATLLAPATHAISLSEAVAIARESSPALIAARLRLAEARAVSVANARTIVADPAIEAMAGRRSGDASSTDYEVSVSQDFELPSARRARIDSASAVLAQAEHALRDVERRTFREVAVAWTDAAAALERLHVAEAGKRLADEALEIASRRYAAGDVAQLDVNLAKTAVARAESEVEFERAAERTAVLVLQTLLGQSAPVSATGQLAVETIAVTDPAALIAHRPDVRQAEAAIAEAEAELRLARTLSYPAIGLRASWAREERDHILLGGFGITLPVFNRSRDASAIAAARVERARAEREALARSIEGEVRTATLRFRAIGAATGRYAATVIPLVEENERLALESYEAGQIGLAELLVVRREALDARRALVDHRVRTHLSYVELRALAGAWQ